MSSVLAAGAGPLGSAAARWLGRDLGRLLAELASPVVEIEPITTLRRGAEPPTTFRVRLADDRIFKARRLGSVFTARRFETLAPYLARGPFSRVVAARGLATIEEWIPGQSLDQTGAAPGAIADAGAVTRWCGDVLGMLHATLLGPEAEPFADRRGSEARMQALDEALAELGAAGALTVSQVRRLSRRARAAMPPEHAAVGLVHGDLAPENVVVRPSGAGLVAVDNTTVAVNALDHDLGRTWYRWPSDENGRAGFIEAYERHRSARPFLDHLDFWLTLVVTAAARFRVAGRSARAEIPLERLRALDAMPMRSRPARKPVRAIFGWSGVTIEVSSRRPPLLLWLEEFFQPWFVPDRESPIDVELRVDLGNGSNTPLGPPERLPDDELDAFVLDTRVIRLPVWREPEGSLIAYDREHGVRYDVGPSRTITIRAREDGAAARVAGMRVVREIAMGAWRRAGGSLIHAAAVSIDGRVVLIGGPKGSGKTSLLLHALRLRASRFISNDRVGVRLIDGRAEAYGIPTIISHRPGTLDPSTRSAAARACFSAVLTLSEASAIAASGASAEGPQEIPSLSPAQLCRLAGAVPARGGPVSAVVLPTVDPTLAGIKLRSLSAGDAGRMVGLLHLGPAGDPSSQLFGPPPGQPALPGAQAEGGDAITVLAAGVPWTEARLGPRAYDTDPWHLRRLID